MSWAIGFIVGGDNSSTNSEQPAVCGMCGNVLECVGVCKMRSNVLECARMYKNVFDYIEVLECVGVCKSVWECTGMCSIT
jgi:hypothetical protein